VVLYCYTVVLASVVSFDVRFFENFHTFVMILPGRKRSWFVFSLDHSWPPSSDPLGHGHDATTGKPQVRSRLPPQEQRLHLPSSLFFLCRPLLRQQAEAVTCSSTISHHIRFWSFVVLGALGRTFDDPTPSKFRTQNPRSTNDRRLKTKVYSYEFRSWRRIRR
jgi:hypothetical protein